MRVHGSFPQWNCGFSKSSGCRLNPSRRKARRIPFKCFTPDNNFYLWCLLVWSITHLAILVLLVTVHFLTARNFDRWPEWAQITWRVVESMLFIGFAASAVFSFFSQRLNYTLRWYIITDRSLRIRTGILAMQELTMTFSNIQEIRISAGPLQNLLKLADVEVHSAGGGSGGKSGGGGHVGRFEGVSNANEIRDLMVERLRQYRDSGLGEAGHEIHSAEDHAVDAARAVLAEVRALRDQLSSSASG